MRRDLLLWAEWTSSLNGRDFANGQVGSNSYGLHVAFAKVPLGHVFSSWSASGGVSLNSASGNNPVLVQVSDPGTLSVSYTPAPITRALLTPVLTLAAIVLLTTLLLRRKRAKL